MTQEEPEVYGPEPPQQPEQRSKYTGGLVLSGWGEGEGDPAALGTPAEPARREPRSPSRTRNKPQAGLLVEGFFLQLHRAAAALALHLLVALDRADVAPVVQLERLAALQPHHREHLQQGRVGEELAGDAHVAAE